MKFVDPKNDVAFKKIFGDENKKEILMSFLNNLLDFANTDKEIIDISIKNPYQVPKLERLKETILDINALDKRGIHYIIEMQVFHTSAFEKRVLYYVSKAYYQQLSKGDQYPRLNQVIFLGFLDFVLFKNKNNTDYATRHLILDEKTNEHYFKDFELNFVELPKFTKTLEELDDIKDKWIYFIKNAGNMTMIPTELAEHEELREAFESANQMTWTKEELEVYDAKGVYIQDERGRVEYAWEAGEKTGMEKGKRMGIKEGEKTGIVKGEKIGMEKGKRVGIEEGEKIGLEKGKEKGKMAEKQAIAQAMLKEGMNLDSVSRLTGLTLDQLTTLKPL